MAAIVPPGPRDLARITGWRNVKDPVYGARGNGVADDTAAIQACIDDAGSQDVVFLPSGTFNYTSLNLNASGCTLQGSGYGSTFLKQTADGDGIKVNVGGGAQTNNVQIRDMLLGASANRASGAAIRLGYTGFFRASNVRITSALGGKPFEGIRIDRASDSHFANVRTQGCASYGAILQPGSSSSVIVEVYFDDECEFKSGDVDGMFLLMDQATVEGVCSLEGIHSAAMHYNNGRAGVRIHATVAGASPRNLHFNGASFDSNNGTVTAAGNADGGLVADASFNATAEIRRLIVDFVGGWCSNNAASGIYFNQVKDFVIIGGEVRSNIKNGIDIQSSKYGRVNVGQITDNSRGLTDTSYGLQFGGSSQYISVAGMLNNSDTQSQKQRGVNFGSSVADIDIGALAIQNQATATVNKINGLTSATNVNMKVPPGGASSVQTGAYTVANDVDLALCDTTSAGFTVTLPRAANFPGREIVVKRTAGANTVTIAATAGTVETTSVTTTPVRHRSNGTNWIAV